MEGRIWFVPSLPDPMPSAPSLSTGSFTPSLSLYYPPSWPICSYKQQEFQWHSGKSLAFPPASRQDVTECTARKMLSGTFLKQWNVYFTAGQSTYDWAVKSVNFVVKSCCFSPLIC